MLIQIVESGIPHVLANDRGIVGRCEDPVLQVLHADAHAGKLGLEESAFLRRTGPEEEGYCSNVLVGVNETVYPPLELEQG